jgi:hypothetical protein
MGESEALEDRGALVVGAVFGMVATGIVGWQAIEWLRTAMWVPLPLSSALAPGGFGPPNLSWAGMQKVALWILDLPVALVPAVLALGCLSHWRESRGP